MRLPFALLLAVHLPSSVAAQCCCAEHDVVIRTPQPAQAGGKRNYAAELHGERVDDHSHLDSIPGDPYRVVLRQHRGCGIANAEWTLREADTRAEKAPAWDGGDLAGRTLLIQHEQGFGDALQFVRSARLAAATAAKVIVVVPKPLRRLLEEIPEITVVCRMPMHYDVYCHMVSLPYRFGTTPDNILAEVPYLFVPVVARKRWSALFVDPVDSERRPLRVGIVWAGQALHVNDSLRSISFELLAPLFSVPGIQWVSLQKDGRPDEMDDLVAGRGWIDPMGDVDDFEDTAAIIDQLDLVITVCTSVTHLAGGLGKKVWTLLSAYPDWRWLITRAEDSPWYPTMRLFRQTSLGDWATVFERIAAEIMRDQSLGTRGR